MISLIKRKTILVGRITVLFAVLTLSACDTAYTGRTVRNHQPGRLNAVHRLPEEAAGCVTSSRIVHPGIQFLQPAGCASDTTGWCAALTAGIDPSVNLYSCNKAIVLPVRSAGTPTADLRRTMEFHSGESDYPRKRRPGHIGFETRHHHKYTGLWIVLGLFVVLGGLFALAFLDSGINFDSSSSEGCFIATACYGDYDAPEVLVLRRYRDETLLRTRVGRLFVRCYYRVSPPLARSIARSEWAKRLIREKLLRPVVKLLDKKQKQDQALPCYFMSSSTPNTRVS